MRVLLLTEERISFTDALVRGGAIHVRNVTEGLRERGHDVILVDWNERPERRFQLSVAPRSRLFDGAVRTFLRATAIGRTTDLDVVVSKTRKTYLPGLCAASVLGIPHVVHVGSSLERPGGGFAERLDTASFEARLRAPHDGYFVVCEWIASQLSERGVSPDRIHDVKNAVDTERFRPDGAPAPLEEHIQDRVDDVTDTFRLGYVGGLQPYKGLDDLATALDDVDADCTVIVAGDGPERERLERRFGDDAVFLGPVPYAQIPALYQQFDAFVLPSHTEGLPRVVLEAQATATPVVATRVGGVPEVVSDGQTGLLCEPREPPAIADAIRRLVAEESLRDRLGERGRQAVTNRYSWDALYDRYERFLRRTKRG